MIGGTMAHDNLTFNMIGATMAHDDLTFHMIGATMAYYDLTFNMMGATMERPSQNPPACLAIKRNCSDGSPVLFYCLSLPEGLGWWTAGSPLLGTLWFCWGKFHCLSLSGEDLLWCQTLFLGAPKSLQMVIAAMKLKDAYSSEEKLWPIQTAY